MTWHVVLFQTHFMSCTHLVGCFLVTDNGKFEHLPNGYIADSARYDYSDRTKIDRHFHRTHPHSGSDRRNGKDCLVAALSLHLVTSSVFWKSSSNTANDGIPVQTSLQHFIEHTQSSSDNKHANKIEAINRKDFAHSTGQFHGLHRHQRLNYSN